MDHELSGNIIDLCPVGALESQAVPLQRPRLGDDRSIRWCRRTMASARNLFGHVLRGELMRVVPRDERGDQRDLDRRSRPLQLRGRLQRGSAAARRMVREATAAGARSTGRPRWRRRPRGCAARGAALGAAGAALQHARGAVSAGAPGAGPGQRATSTIDCAGAISATRPPMRVYPSLGMPIAAIDQLDALLVIGSNLRREVPVLAHRVRKAALRGRAGQLPESGALRLHVPGGAYLQSAPAGAGGAIWPRCWRAARADRRRRAGALRLRCRRRHGRPMRTARSPTALHGGRAARGLARRAGAASARATRPARAGARARAA